MTGLSLGSTTATGVYVGSTLATGVYFGSTKVWPAGIAPVGASQLNTVFNDGVANNVPIPSGSQTGDVLLLAGQATPTNATFSVTPPSGSVTVKGKTTFYTLGNSTWFAFAYLYTLTASDITNGTVPLTVNASGGGTLEVAAFSMRGAVAAIDGTVGQVLQSTLQALPVSMTAPGITTANDGDLLISFEAVSTSSTNTASPYVFTPPYGWADAIDTYKQSQSPVSMSYKRQGTAGATGDVTGTLSRNDAQSDSTAYVAWLFAIKKYVPSNATVDDFSVAGTINNYTITTQGTTGGTGAVSSGDLVLTPVANAGNSVAARRSGPWSGVEVQASLAKITSGGTPKYFDVCIGSGTVTTDGAGNYWYACLSDGYLLRWNDTGNAFSLRKMSGGSGITVATYGTNFGDLGAGSHSYGLRYNKTTQNVEMVLDGAVVGTPYNDPSFAAGDVLVAQGAYINGDGCIASIPTVTLTP